MKRMKKKLLALSMTAICISAVAAGTLAYYTSETTVHNTISSGKIEIEIAAEDGDNTHFVQNNNIDGIMPGKTMDYNSVVVENTGSSPAWIRVHAETVITASDGTGLSNKIDGTDEYVIQYVLGEGWTDNINGFYYYKEPIEGVNNPSKNADLSTVTNHLIQAVKVNPKMGNAYQGCDVLIKVDAQAVQSKNNPIPEGGDVTDVKGWPTIEIEPYDTAKEE